MSECKVVVDLMVLVLHDTLPLLHEHCISATVPHSEAAPVLTIRIGVPAHTTSKPTFCCGLKVLHISYGCCSIAVQSMLRGFFLGAWW